jgi:hypothetical protein
MVFPGLVTDEPDAPDFIDFSPGPPRTMSAEEQQELFGRYTHICYWVAALECARVKIGYVRCGHTRKDTKRARAKVNARFQSLQTGSPFELTILYLESYHYREKDTEKEYHRQFAAERIRGEWFNFTPAMREFILLKKSGARV